ncbi:MAG TPA: hypothetical protein VG917_03915 [Patescibacteria group bacterium]|nr:hypothetical protein [Patescibacteria group bacterium]
MNKLIVLLLFVFLLLPSAVFAQDIVTGDSSVSTTNTNTINNGEVHSHIEVNVNGEEKVIDSDKPGTTSVNISNSGGQTTVKTEMSAGSKSDSKEDATPSASPTPHKIYKKIVNNNPLSIFFKSISGFLSKIF